MKRSFPYVVATAWLVCAGCVTTPPYNPFKVEKTEIMTRVKKVVVMPMDIGTSTLNVTNALLTFEKRTAEQLEKLGFEVVPADRVRPITEKMKAQMGGLFDPNTGKPDEEKVKRLKDLIRKEMVTQFKADAIASPLIITHGAPFTVNKAAWNGRRQDLSRGSAMGKIFGAQMSGTVGVISYVINIQSSAGEEMFVNAGGIQALSYLAGGQFVEIPPQEILADDAINKEAVELAFEPFEERPAKK